MLDHRSFVGDVGVVSKDHRYFPKCFVGFSSELLCFFLTDFSECFSRVCAWGEVTW